MRHSMSCHVCFAGVALGLHPGNDDSQTLELATRAKTRTLTWWLWVHIRSWSRNLLCCSLDEHDTSYSSSREFCVGIVCHREQLRCLVFTTVNASKGMVIFHRYVKILVKWNIDTFKDGPVWRRTIFMHKSNSCIYSVTAPLLPLCLKLRYRPMLSLQLNPQDATAIMELRRCHWTPVSSSSSPSTCHHFA